MDWGSLAGLALALGAVLLGHSLEGGDPGFLLQPAGFLIVMLGTLGAVLLQSGMPGFVRGLKMVRRVFAPPADNFPELAGELCLWSSSARREGVLSLERYAADVRDPFVAQCLQLVIDGVELSRLRELFDQKISAYETRERLAVRVWEAAGGYAPTIGILGAVLGLVQVMENLSDPGRLGTGIAAAFIATLYGVGLANLIFLPIAGKLKALVSRDVRMHELVADALIGIASGEHPRVIAERLAPGPG